MAKVFTIKDLSIFFDTPDGRVDAVNNISLDLNHGECFQLLKIIPPMLALQLEPGKAIPFFRESQLVRDLWRRRPPAK